MTTEHTQELKASFYALPNSPHLTHSWCDYTLIALHGLKPDDITTDKVTRVTVNGMEQQTRMMGKTTVMIYPKIKEEAQTVNVFYTAPAASPKPFKPVQYSRTEPDLSYGFTPRSTPYGGS